MNVFDLFATLSLDKSEYEKGLNDAEKDAKNLSDKWSAGTADINKGLKNIGTGVGVFTALGAGAFKAADGVSKNLDNIDKMSQKLGLSTDAYQEWDYVMQISGTSIDNMAMGLKTLTNKFDDAKNGSSNAVEMFEKLGLSMDDIKDLSREDLFSQVIYAFQGMEDSAERAALANDLLGRSGQELAPLFNTSAEETQNLIAQVRDLGGVMSEDAVKQGAQFQDSLTGLKTAFAGASASLLEKLIPAITDLMDRIAEFVANGGLDKIIDTLEKLAPVIAAVVSAIAGFKIVSGVISLVQGLTTVFGVLNAVMAANPIGLVVIAIGALIAAFVLLWNNCEGFRNFFVTMWEGIKSIISGVVEFFKTAFTTISTTISDTWNKIKEGATNALNNIKEVFQNIGGWFKEKFVQAKDNVINAWSNIKASFSNIWNNIKSAFKFSDALKWGRDLMTNFINGIKQKWNDLKNTMSNMSATVRSYIHFSEPDVGPLSDFHTYAPDMMKTFAKGIKDNTYLVTDQIGKSFDFGDDLTNSTDASAQAGYSSGPGDGGALQEVIALLQKIANKELAVSPAGLLTIVKEQNDIYKVANGGVGAI